MKTNTSGMKTCLVNLQRVSLAVSRITFPTIPFLCLRGRSCVSCTGPKGSSGRVYSGGSERPPVQLPLPAALRGSPGLFLRLLQPGDGGASQACRDEAHTIASFVGSHGPHARRPHFHLSVLPVLGLGQWGAVRSLREILFSTPFLVLPLL